MIRERHEWYSRKFVCAFREVPAYEMTRLDKFLTKPFHDKLFSKFPILMQMIIKNCCFQRVIPALCIVAFILVLAMGTAKTLVAEEHSRPNILWLVAEDICNNLGCYSDDYATTPNIDRFASQGLRYVNCWSNAPVCAPARTALLTGMFPPSLGAQHMRSLVPIPPTVKPYPLFLKEKGYYTTNNAKTDYNVIVNLKQIWDQCDNQAHWKNRQPEQPFFAVFNFEISHESQIRNNNTLAVARRHDPAKARVPAYHPDTPEVRKDWAQYYDRITQLDDQIQLRLDELDEAGLADDTIVFIYGDNGGGMPRSKRTPLQTGLEVPLIIRIPDKYKHLTPEEYAPNGVSERVVSFVDFAPTLLSLIGEKTPEIMHGKAFAGHYDLGPQPYIYGFRGRMDERYDECRSIRDDRYVLALNLYPHIPFGAHNAYMFETPTTRVWKQLYDEGKLPPEQAFFFEMKPPIELYDLQTDRDQVRNLAGLPEYRETRDRLLTALLCQMGEIRDLGFLPEAMFQERSQNSTPYEMGHDPQHNDFDALVNCWLYNMISPTLSFDNGVLKNIRGGFIVLRNDTVSKDDAVRFWTATRMLHQLAGTAGADGSQPTELTRQVWERLREPLEKLAADEQKIVRIPAAEALGRFGNEADASQASRILWDIIDDETPKYYYRALQAFNALDGFAKRITDPEFRDKVQAVVPTLTPPNNRVSESFGKITQHILEQ